MKKLVLTIAIMALVMMIVIGCDADPAPKTSDSDNKPGTNPTGSNRPGTNSTGDNKGDGGESIAGAWMISQRGGSFVVIFDENAEKQTKEIPGKDEKKVTLGTVCMYFTNVYDRDSSNPRNVWDKRDYLPPQAYQIYEDGSSDRLDVMSSGNNGCTSTFFRRRICPNDFARYLSGTYSVLQNGNILRITSAEGTNYLTKITFTGETNCTRTSYPRS